MSSARALLVVGGTTSVLAMFIMRRRLARLTVVGHSMEPALLDRQRVWIWRPSTRYRYRVDQIVAFEHERGHGSPPLLVKRIAEIHHVRASLDYSTGHGDAPGSVWVLGDAESSLDSRNLGPIPIRSIRGVVLQGGRQCG